MVEVGAEDGERVWIPGGQSASLKLAMPSLGTPGRYPVTPWSFLGLIVISDDIDLLSEVKDAIRVLILLLSSSIG